MDLNQIKQYNHKIKTVQIVNKNRYSLYDNVLVKINVSSRDDEIVRFSLDPNDNFVDHQQINDDYYCYIPNNLNSKTTVYIHFFPTDLYEYEMLEDLISEYDLKELIESATITSNRYEQNFDEDGHLIVQSTDEKSVTHYHDPNYKQYQQTTPANNKTEQGKFPLSSRYRSEQNWEVPDLKDANPQWKKTTSEAPYWQARIPFKNLDVPLNVFINYEYLPSSREYHQHYFGFEQTDMDNETNQCKTISVFEGTNINEIDSKFGSDNNYRLINLGNPYDDSHSIFVPHENTIPINMENFNEYIGNQQVCRWKHHQCKNYYVYSPLNVNTNDLTYCHQKVDLKTGHYYSLQYYIYIPSKATVTSDSCYIAVNVDGVDYKMDSAFIAKDKTLRDQWVYHEVPFLAGDENEIKIVGPQGSQKEYPYEDSIYFIYLELREMVEYSPTLQYGSTGLRITEQDQSVLKPQLNSETQSNCTKTTISPDNKQYQSEVKEFPKPYSDVNIITKDEKYVYYDPYTTNLIYVHNPDDDDAIWYDESTGKLHIPGDDDIQFRYDSESNLYGSFGERLTGIYGPDNTFIFDFVDTNGDYVTDGEVEISILTQQDRDTTNKGMWLTRKPKTVTGHMVFSGIDLSNLSKDQNKYYIRLIYTNRCMELTNDKPKIVFKPLYVYEEDAKFNEIRINDTELSINATTHKVADYHINSIDQFPLKIEAQITDQNDSIKKSGYCELSINDKMNQTTLVDTTGWADFYLTQDDLEIGRQTVKIEYYRQYNHSLAFIYFDIVVDSLDDFKDYVKIDIKILKDGMTQPIPIDNVFEIGSDDCVLSVINTHNHSKFRLEVYRSDNLNTPIIKKNIYNKNMQDTSFIHATWDEWQTHNSYTFKIVTGNMLDENGNVIQDLYRDYERSFTIRKRTA